MEGYRLRSRSVPPDTWALTACPLLGQLLPLALLKGLWMSRCRLASLMAAKQPKAGYPFMDTQVETASAGQSWATTLRALLPNSPQEVRDTSAQEDTAQVPDPEAFANVGASIGLGQTTLHALSSKSCL